MVALRMMTIMTMMVLLLVMVTRMVIRLEEEQ